MASTINLEKHSDNLYSRQTLDIYVNSPSPVIFPNSSHTPRLLSTPSKKLPEIQSWQGIESFSVLEREDEKIMLSIENKSCNNTLEFFVDNELFSVISFSTASPSPSIPEKAYSSNDFPSVKNHPIIGSPVTKEQAIDPIIERLACCSLSDSSKIQDRVMINRKDTHSMSRLNALLSKLKKTVSGRQSII